jgi:hypothetical protein
MDFGRADGSQQLVEGEVVRGRVPNADAFFRDVDPNRASGVGKSPLETVRRGLAHSPVADARRLAGLVDALLEDQ